MWRPLPALLVGSVDEDESAECREASSAGDAGLGVMFVAGKKVGTASAMDGDSGSSSFLSLIEMTIFSSPNDVMCFSLPRPRLSIASTRYGDGRLISTGADCRLACLSILSGSSDATESTLADNSGTSLDAGLGPLKSIAGVVVSCG